MNAMPDTSYLEPIKRLTRDLRVTADQLTDREARYLVDAYYMMQRNRVRSGNQMAKLEESGEPNAVIGWLTHQDQTLENQIRLALDRYSRAQPISEWMRAQKGIGPVISAGFIAHIDIKKAPTAGHIWRFAGLDPTVKWKKKTKRPWNASLKTLCWKTGESFVKFSGGDEPGYYGLVYKSRKEFEIEQNDAGAFAEQAAAALVAKKFRDDAVAKTFYEAGKLPPGHIHARAKRYAVKLFLSHLQAVWWKLETGEDPPRPYVISILGHGHYLPPPD